MSRSLPTKFSLTYALLALTLAASLGFSGCIKNSATEIVIPSTAIRVQNPSEIIGSRTAGSNWLGFLNWDGRLIGTDDDGEIQLGSDGIAKLVVYGNAVTEFEGTYEIQPPGVDSHPLIAFRFDEIEAEIPTFELFHDGDQLLLVPVSMPDGRLFSVNRKTLTKGDRIPGDNAWLLREIYPDSRFKQ